MERRRTEPIQGRGEGEEGVGRCLWVGCAPYSWAADVPVRWHWAGGRTGCDALGPTERESNSLTAELDFHAKAMIVRI